MFTYFYLYVYNTVNFYFIFYRYWCFNRAMSRLIKAVIFDIGGVLIPTPVEKIAAYALKVKLPPNILTQAFVKNADNNAFAKLERGEMTLTEFYSDFEQEVSVIAKENNVELPTAFNTAELFRRMAMLDKEEADDSLPYYPEMLNAVCILRKKGFLTGVITNNWKNDEADCKAISAQFSHFLKPYFNCVVESCKVGFRKPDNKIYEIACSKLNVKPSEAVFLDDLGQNLKAAKNLGMKTIKVKDTKTALEELEKLTSVMLIEENVPKVPLPPPSKSKDLAHGYVETAPGVRIHYVELGTGPTVIFLHGFPDSWYGYRYQIHPVAMAGYRVICPDQRGYGDSSAPENIVDYSQERLCADIIALMDTLAIPTATVVGHDWGGGVAWNLALHYPDRFTGVCGVNTPFFPTNPSQNPLKAMERNPGVFDYQLYFQTPGVAEKELETNLERTFSVMYQGANTTKDRKSSFMNSSSNVRARGGVLVGLPEDLKRSLLSEQELKYYVEQYQKSGFRGPLNWYRNYEENWKWGIPKAGKKINIPALMVTASHDFILKHKYSLHMENFIPNLKRLYIENCSHWTLVERPQEFNAGFITWLNSLHKVSSKM